jgi:acetylglutamate kinase
MGVTPMFVGGRRITRQSDIMLLRMALSGAANKALVSLLLDHGVPAVGLSGEDGGMLVADRTPDERLGLVGDRVRVQPRLLDAVLEAGLLPVLSPLARGHDGGALNVNADDAAAAIAAALAAEALLLISDVSGILVNGEPRPTLALDEARALIGTGIARDGMAAKLEAAAIALERGVGLVRIGDLALLEHPAAGTRLHAAPRPTLSLVS